MAGTVDLMSRAYTGIELRGDVLRFNPCLPAELSCFEMQIRYLGHTLDLEITQEQLKVSCVRASDKSIKIAYLDQVYDLEPRGTVKIPL